MNAHLDHGAPLRHSLYGGCCLPAGEGLVFAFTSLRWRRLLRDMRAHMEENLVDFDYYAQSNE